MEMERRRKRERETVCTLIYEGGNGIVANLVTFIKSPLMYRHTTKCLDIAIFKSKSKQTLIRFNVSVLILLLLCPSIEIMIRRVPE